MIDSVNDIAKRALTICRVIVLVAICCEFFCSPSRPCFGDEKTRYVLVDDCLVYGGPEESLYPTAKLSKGSMVEVYHETEDGWSGIRPPAGSFDWVAADSGHLLPGGKTLQIIGRPTPAWIGTYQSIARDSLKWQIELKPSQVVAVIGEAIQPQMNASDKTWFKIQPPQGEFRWIPSVNLSVNPLPSFDLTNNKTSNVVMKEPRLPDLIPLKEAVDTDHDRPVVQAAATQKRIVSSKTYPSRSSLNKTQSPKTYPSVAQRSVLYETPSEPVANSTKSGSQNEDDLPPKADSMPRSLLNQGSSNTSSEAKTNGIYLGESQYSEPMVGDYADSSDVNGQLIPGEHIVGAMGDGEFTEGEIIGEEFIDSDLAYQPSQECCQTCGESGGCDCMHQTDSFDHWDAMRNSANPKLRLHPVGKLLGLIGITISEAEVVNPETPCTRCGTGNPRMAFGANPPSPSPRFGERFQHLPRPGRRMRAAFDAGWMGDANFNRSTSSLAMSGTPSNPDLSSKGAWHAPMKSGLETPDVNSNSMTGNTSSASNNLTFVQPRFGNSDIALVSNEDFDSLQFSTPEIQNAMMELSSIVSQPTERWVLTGPMNQAKYWIQNSNDTIARGEARLLLERVERFEVLRQRSLAVSGQNLSGNNLTGKLTAAQSTGAPISFAGFQRPVAKNELVNSALPNTPPQDIANRNPDGTQASDASGWLVEVFSQQPGQPEFALTDDAGGLIAYVVAPPGMNLRRYLKQPVGIYGVKGYLPNLSARQITAERIVRVR